MTWTSITPIIVWAVIVIPLTILIWWKPPTIKLNAILAILGYAMFNLLAYWIINWAILYYYLRFASLILILLVSLRVIGELSKRPFLPKGAGRIAGATLLFVVLFLLGIIAYPVVRSFSRSGEQVLLFFPLRSGFYIVTNAGNSLEASSATNNHYKNWPGSKIIGPESQALAADIVEIGIAGLMPKKASVLPESRFDYHIFTEYVHSPCYGEIIYVEDGHPDADLTGETSGIGNFVVMKCVDYYITIGNLKKNSILVKVGDRTSLNTMLGQVGSSGEYPIPHLHIHATQGSWKDGEGAPVSMIFDGAFAINNFLTRNKIVLR
jgi:hypothetical protein